MAISINDLVKELTPEEILADLIEVATALGLSTSSWQPGEPVYAVLDFVCTQLSRLWNRYILPAIKSGFLDYAEGAWLTLLASAVYYVFRRQATFATGPVTLENRNIAAPFTFVPGDIRIKIANGKTATNTTGDALAPWSGTGDYPTVTLTFTADEIGSESSSAVGEIEGYPTTLVVGPAGVFPVENTNALIAQDEEEDASVVDRCRLSTGPLSPAGPKSAYEYVALSVRKDADGNPVMPWQRPAYDTATSLNITRARVIDDGEGGVDVWLASASGAASGDTVTAGSDVFIANVAIQIWARAAGIRGAAVAAAVEVPIDWTVTVYVDRRQNLTAADAVTIASAALSSFQSTIPIGGFRIEPDQEPDDTGFIFANEVTAKASESHAAIFRATMEELDAELEPNEVAVPAISVEALAVTP